MSFTFSDDQLKLLEAKDLLTKELGAGLKNSLKLTCGHDVSVTDQVVCPESFAGTLFPVISCCYNSSWSLNTTNCAVANPDWSKLVTLLLFPKVTLTVSDVEERFRTHYKGIRVVVASTEEMPFINDDDDNGIRGVEVSGAASSWRALVSSVRTPFAIVATSDLNVLTAAAQLERSIRLLQNPWVGAVAGSTRNLTGHWTVAQCRQADIVNYVLELRPGYRESACDCMICGTAVGAPFVARAETLKKFFTLTEASRPETLWLSWFLDVQRSGLQTLLCPDVLYLTYRGEWHPDTLPRNEWRILGERQQFLGVVTNFTPSFSHTFKCEQVGLKCSPRSQQSDAILLPWCCLANFVFILNKVDAIAREHRFHYELDSGSALGAVKLGHYLPWDIDGDIVIQTSAVALFDEGSPGSEAMVASGVTVFGRSPDNYGDKGAGYFKLWYGGVEVEMLGRRGNGSLLTYPEFRGMPTRVLVGDVWVRSHANPGAYARSRYGTGYLAHSQSWRYLNSDTSFMKYKGGAHWRLCPDPGFHACLEKYPTDGNILFHPDTFKVWNDKTT